MAPLLAAMTFQKLAICLAPLGVVLGGCHSPDANGPVDSANASLPTVAPLHAVAPLPSPNSVVSVAGVKTPMRSFASVQGYTINLPLSWKLNFNTASGADLMCQAPVKPGAPVPNFNVVVDKAPNLTLDEVEKQIGALYPRQFAGYQLVGRTRTRLDGAEALSNAVSYQLGKPPRRFALQQIIALHNGKAYTFTATIPLDQARHYGPLITVMLASVRWAK